MAVETPRSKDGTSGQGIVSFFMAPLKPADFSNALPLIFTHSGKETSLNKNLRNFYHPPLSKSFAFQACSYSPIAGRRPIA
jgi:hypothetical protein